MRTLGILIVVAFGFSDLALAAPSPHASSAVTAGSKRRATVAGRGAVVSASGRVGDLRIDKSTAAAIRRFAGTPAFDGIGTFAAPQFPKTYRALGYECSHVRSVGADPGAYRPAHVHCRTIYFLSPRTHRLAAFWTNSTRFRTSRGTRPGMSQNEADGLEHAQPKVGAFIGIFRRTQTATFLIENVGCKPSSHANPNPCLGGSVDSFSLESMRNPVGLIFE